METPSHLKVALLSPEKRIENTHGDESVANVLIPGKNGYFVASAKHTDLIAEIGIGVLTLLGGSNETVQQYFVAGGFVQMDGGNTLKVLADVIETPTEVQIERAQEAQKRAVDRLKVRASVDQDLNFERANEALARARYRIDLSKEKKN